MNQKCLFAGTKSPGSENLGVELSGRSYDMNGDQEDTGYLRQTNGFLFQVSDRRTATPILESRQKKHCLTLPVRIEYPRKQNHASICETQSSADIKMCCISLVSYEEAVINRM
jgi:hypothetical protein